MLNLQDIEISTNGLFKLLASVQILAAKTQNFHWNVKDQRFEMLHELFGAQYAELVANIDEIAERIRILGMPVKGLSSSYLQHSIVTESDGLSAGNQILAVLLNDHQLIINFLRDLIDEVSKTRDQGTLDFLIGQLQYHEKTSWFISSHII